MKLFYRIASTADGGLARTYPHAFDGIAIAGQLLALHPDWVADLVRSVGKPFFIDPASYVFGLDLGNIYKEGELRQSFGALAAQLRLSPVLDDDREIQQQDIVDTSGSLTDLGRELVARVIEANKLQWGEGALQLALEDYATMLEEGEVRQVEPLFVVPPYFYDWLDVNVVLAREMKTQVGTSPVYIVFSIAKERLGDQQVVNQMLGALPEFDGCLLWVSDFQERNEPVEKLARFGELVKALAGTGKPVHNLYGGGFSAMCGVLGLAGYSRGICTSESRDVYMETGQGAPSTRYYVSEALNKIVIRRAQRLYAMSGLPLCSCPVCTAALGDVPADEPQSSAAARLFGALSGKDTRAHFMERHHDELRSLHGLDMPGVRGWMGNRISVLAQARTGGLIPSDHLSRWSQALDMVQP